MRRIAMAAVAELTLVVVLVACDSSSKDVPSAAPVRRGQPAFLTEGTTRRLNLPTPEARASVLYKDPVQGVKDASGKCRFPDIGQNSGKMRIGLGATVGEWDTETCAGLLYYFKPSTRPHPKPSKEETSYVTPADTTSPRVAH